jgi:hypothetical protein
VGRTDPGLKPEPGFCFASFTRVHHDTNVLERAAFDDRLGAASKNRSIPCHGRAGTAAITGVNKPGIGIGIGPWRPKGDTPEVVDECEYSRLLRINLGTDLHLMGAWQQEADENHENERSDYSIEYFLHFNVLIVERFGLDYSTVERPSAQCVYEG